MFLMHIVADFLISGSTRNPLCFKNPGLFEQYSCQRIHKYSEREDELILHLPIKDESI